MSRSDFREQIEALKILGEEFRLDGDPPETVGIECNDCGVRLEVPFAQVDDLVDAMAGHVELCPAREMPECD
jgi:hypothetical protein